MIRSSTSATRPAVTRWPDGKRRTESYFDCRVFFLGGGGCSLEIVVGPDFENARLWQFGGSKEAGRRRSSSTRLNGTRLWTLPARPGSTFGCCYVEG